MRCRRGEVDEVAVDRLVHGERVNSNVSERIEATRQLTHWGYTVNFIAAHMHVTGRSVDRYRHELLLQRGVQL